MDNRYVIIEVYGSMRDRLVRQNLVQVVIATSEAQYMRTTTRLVKQGRWLISRRPGDGLTLEGAVFYLYGGE